MLAKCCAGITSGPFLFPFPCHCFDWGFFHFYFRKTTSLFPPLHQNGRCAAGWRLWEAYLNHESHLNRNHVQSRPRSCTGQPDSLPAMLLFRRKHFKIEGLIWHSERFCKQCVFSVSWCQTVGFIKRSETGVKYMFSENALSGCGAQWMYFKAAGCSLAFRLSREKRPEIQYTLWSFQPKYFSGFVPVNRTRSGKKPKIAQWPDNQGDIRSRLHASECKHVISV